MSRIANVPVLIPNGVETTISDAVVKIKGKKGDLSLALNSLVVVSQDGEELKVSAKDNSRPICA